MLTIILLELLRYIATAIIFIIAICYFWFQWRFSHWARKGVPGPTPSFPAGNIGDVFTKKKQFFQPFVENYSTYKKYPYIGMYTLYNPVLLVNDLNLARNILVRDFNHFETHGTLACEKVDPLSVHIFNLHGEKWRKVRQNFSPIFSTGKIRGMIDHLLVVAKDFQCHIDKTITDEVPENLTLSFSKFSIDVIGRVAFGLECNSFKDPNSAFVRNGFEFFEPSTFYWKIMRTLWFLTPELFSKLRTARIKPETTKFFLNLVKETVAYREANNVERNDFLQMLIQLKNNVLRDEQGNLINSSEAGMSWTQMAAHSMVFLAAGYESTSSTAAFAVYELAQYPEVLDKTRAEIFSVLGKHEGKITYEALAEMDYLTLVIEETLRKHPPMRALFRRCTKNYRIPGTKILVEEGTWVFVPIQAFQNDSDIFPNPDKFIPERFLPENKTAKQIAAYMPFGDGPKMCLGVRFGMMAAKIALISFLTKYDFKLAPQSPVPMQYSTRPLSLAADPGVYVHVKPLRRQCNT